MTLTLRIENFDVLDHGGPISISLNQKGCDVGRGGSMDWVLPDPNRLISSRHFSVEFRDGAYWLTDTSTNGTHLQGSPYRLQGPHRISNGDRFTVGPYIVLAQMPPPVSPGFQAPPSHTQGPSMIQRPPVMTPQPMGHDDHDPWDFGGSAQPVNPLPMSRPGPRHLDDIAGDFVPSSVPMPNPGDRSAPPQGFQPSPFAPPGNGHSAPASPGGDAFLRAFCEGAGLNPADYPAVDVEKVARQLGLVVAQSTREIMSMLQDRAAVKQFTKGGERTMRSATGNNPMKFLPDTQQALEIMFLKPRDGFMAAPEGFENALRDIRRHQSAVFAALQPALASVLSGMSPDEIEDGAGTGLLGGASKSKFWDAYVERWDAKAEAGENGLLDSFLQAFARAYAAAAGKAAD